MNKITTDSHWGLNDIPDQTGRVAIVTGANSGIGLETARALAAQNAHVILAVRSAKKGQQTVKSIRKHCPSAKLDVMLLDLSRLSSIKDFVDEFARTHSRLDLLVNNAGIMMCPYDVTLDGFETQLGINHLGHFALTLPLLPLLQKTPQSRVVVVASLAHRRGKLNAEDLHWQKRSYDTSQAYADSKLANLLFAFELNRKITAQGHNHPLIVAAHPGWTITNLARHTWKFRFMSRFFAQDSTTGALPTLRAAVDPSVKSGSYYGPAGERELKGPPIPVTPTDDAMDIQAAQQLWGLSEELTGVYFEKEGR